MQIKRAPRPAIRRLPLLVLLAAGSLGVPGCIPAYTRATSEFADSAVAGMDAFIPAFDTASALCESRARYDYAFARVQNLNDERWSSYITKHEIPEGGTWATHCARLSEGDEMLLAGLQAIVGYGNALSALAKTGDYDGADLGGLVKNSADLAAKLDSSRSEHTDKVKDLAGPIGEVAGWIVQAHARRKLRKAIKDADPHVNAILAALTAYNDATEIELRDAREKLEDLLDAADVRLVVAPAGPNVVGTGMPLQPSGMTVLAFHDSARTYERELDDYEAKQVAYGRVIRGLTAAQAALVAAADEKKSDVEAMQEVLGIASEIVTQVAAIKSVADGE